MPHAAVESALMKKFAGRSWLVSVACLGALVPSSAGVSRAGGAPDGSTSYAVVPRWQVVVPAAGMLHLSGPMGLAIDRRGTGAQKWMYVADTGNNRVVKIGTGGHVLGRWGSRGEAPGRFQHPEGVAVDGRGDVYVADTGNNRVQKFGAQGRLLASWGTKGSGPGQFSNPAAVAVGGSGNVFVADRENKRIEKFSPSGRLLAVWPVTIPHGTTFPGFGPAGPYALAVDVAGNIDVAVDTGQCSGGHCVMDYILLQTFSSTGVLVRSVAGGNPYGPFSYQPVSGVTSLQGPWWQIGGLAVDSSARVFLAVWNPQDRASVTEVSSAGKQFGQWELPAPSGSRGWPAQGIALDPRGTVYVADTRANRVLKLAFRP